MGFKFYFQCLIQKMISGEFWRFRSISFIGTGSRDQLISCTGWHDKLISCKGSSAQLMRCTGSRDQLISCTGSSCQLMSCTWSRDQMISCKGLWDQLLDLIMYGYHSSLEYPLILNYPLYLFSNGYGLLLSWHFIYDLWFTKPVFAEIRTQLFIVAL